MHAHYFSHPNNPPHIHKRKIKTQSFHTERKPAMKTTTVLTLTVLLAAATLLSNAAARDVKPPVKKGSSGGQPGEVPGIVPNPFGPGGAGFGSIPGFDGRNPGWGGGYGAGYGGPGGGYARGGVIRPTVVCSDHGPCYKKKLTCPAKCFTSYSRSGKNYGSGGGGGGCTMDCKKHCIAYC